MTDEPTIKVGFDKSDAIRSAWAFLVPFVVVFLVGTLGVLNDLVESCNKACDWSAASTAFVALAIGLASSVIIGVKNLLLANGSRLKG